MDQTPQPDWLIDGKIPFIWVIDDVNQGFPTPDLTGLSLFDDRYLGRLRSLVNELNAKICINFVIQPEYAKAGLKDISDLETPLAEPVWRPYHRELQDWLAELGDRAEVIVHGWTHRMANYTPEIELDPGGWEFTRRSEWLFHPDPVGNFDRNLEALRKLGYQPVTHVLSNCGGRLDRETLRKLRQSPHQMLIKFPTHETVRRADYPEVPSMPWYLGDLDAFIFAWDLKRDHGPEDFEAAFARRKPIFLVNHGHEFGDRTRFQKVRSIGAMLRFFEAHSNELFFVRLGDYSRLMHQRVHGARQ